MATGSAGFSHGTAPLNRRCELADHVSQSFVEATPVAVVSDSESTSDAQSSGTAEGCSNLSTVAGYVVTIALVISLMLNIGLALHFYQKRKQTRGGSPPPRRTTSTSSEDSEATHIDRRPGMGTRPTAVRLLPPICLS